MFITWMHCCIDKEHESKLQIKLKTNNIHSNAHQYCRDQQQQWPSPNVVIVAIVENHTNNGCLQVNVVKRIIPISSVTTTTFTSPATCLLLLKPSPSPLSLLNVNANSYVNFGNGDSILCVHIRYDCTTATKPFLPLHQQTHCQIMNTIEMKMNCLVDNGADPIAQSMCTNRTKNSTTIKLVETKVIRTTNDTVGHMQFDECKAIKLKAANSRRCELNDDCTEWPNNTCGNKLNGHRRLTHETNCPADGDDDDQSDGANTNAFATMRAANKVADLRAFRTERRHHYSKLPNKFTIVNTLYIDYRKMFCTFLLPLLLLLCNLTPLIHAECDQTFVSRIGGPQNGTFTAPVMNNLSNHSRQCLYIFLAGPGQRVEITFTSFNLRGSPPDGAAVGEIPSCAAEYMDIYSEVQSSDPADLINSPFGGRYCGPNLPRRRISLYRAIALSFFTSKNATAVELFTGRYSFINASIFEIGTPITGSPCSFTITPHKNKSDVFISPTYPGAYPKDLFCTYHFIGESNQRVRLEFRDFDLFSGGTHCPFDFVKVYDGPDNSSALIGTYCGQQRNLVLYSSESSLLVHFFTLRRTASTQNRGFKGIYEFSEGFVKLDFIRENNGMHIRGSECDQKILSKKESSGLVYSPNYPFPYLPKTVCRYFIYGLQDAQHLERVRLEFSMFEIQKGEHKDINKETNCTDGYLKIFLKGQETQDAYDKFDYELCGFDLPHSVVSDGPRLAMVFSSGELQARGFKAKYTFETEYKIPGTAAPDGSCAFTYKSTSRKKGEFNSPRFPSKYISDTNCTYMFLATPNEQVTIVFDVFKVKADNANATSGAYGAIACTEDWIEIFILFRDGNDRFIGRYCGTTAPGPVESPRGATGIRIQLHTDAENVSSGFKARYIFEVAKSVTGDCGGNYSGQESDIITSPNYPGKYHGPGKGLASRACNWYITARFGYRISMNFEFFSVEGDPPSRGCPAAALRIWTAPDTDHAPIELCGDKLSGDIWHYLSDGQAARISFITTDKTIGAQGFRIVWTEVQDTPQLSGAQSIDKHHCDSAYLFRCTNSKYCIASKLHCDGIKNCGPGDDSDELNCTIEVTKDESGALIISSLAAGSFLICLVCTVYHRRKRRKPHHRQLGLHRSGGHYDSTTSATGLGSSRRHLQSGNSLSGSLHYGINSDDDILPIPQPPLPPTSVPPHLIINCTDDLDDDDMDDDDVDDGDDGDMAEIDVDDEELAAAISNEQHHSIHHHHHQQQLVNNMIGNQNLQDDIFFSGSNDRFINVDSV